MQFNPLNYNLSPDFKLTNFSELKGMGSKVPRDVLIRLLDSFNTTTESDKSEDTIEAIPEKLILPYEQPPEENSPSLSVFSGLDLDSSITPLQNGNLYLVQSTNYMYPIIDDPYLMGKIACSSIVGNAYALGIKDIDNLLMLLTTSNKMTPNERDAVIPLLMKGFQDCAIENVGTNIQGGQTIVNPWVMIGGVVTSVCSADEFIRPCHAIPGDVLVLTKPLGVQVAVTAYSWLGSRDPNLSKIIDEISEDAIVKSYHRAISSMLRLNKTAASLMTKYNAHAATDIGGYGLLGHAMNLVRSQKETLAFTIHNLPILARMANVSRVCGNLLGLLHGNSPETSGGLLIALPREQAAAFCKEIQNIEGHQAWIIGVVEKSSTPTAKIIEKPWIIEVPAKDLPNELW